MRVFLASRDYYYRARAIGSAIYTQYVLLFPHVAVVRARTVPWRGGETNGRVRHTIRTLIPALYLQPYNRYSSPTQVLGAQGVRVLIIIVLIYSYISLETCVFIIICICRVHALCAVLVCVFYRFILSSRFSGQFRGSVCVQNKSR